MKNLSNEIIGQSAVITELRQALKDIAASDMNLMITGESGSGKEFIITELIKLIKKDYTFQKINCPELKNDKEIFRKVITENTVQFCNAAETDKKYKILYLNKICDLNMGLQKELLDFIDNMNESVENKLNASHSRNKIRIISSTNKNIHLQAINF